MESCGHKGTETLVLFHELLARVDDYHQIALQTPSNGCVYVMAVPGIEAVRIGRTVDLLQRLRWFEYKSFPIEVILLGQCNMLDPDARRAEAKIFNLLDDIHLSKHNLQLYGSLVGAGYDWYLPDRRRILQAFSSLCRGNAPRFMGVQKQPLFEHFTKMYPSCSTADQITWFG